MGIRASSTYELHFDNCRVHKDNLIGGDGKGLFVAQSTFDISRPGVASQALGIAQGALDETLAYGRLRKQFGQNILSFQSSQHMIADMVMDLELMRMLSYRAARIGDAGLTAERAVTATKLFCNEALFRIANMSLQIHGGNGYSEEYPVERHFRDARVTMIGEGTTQIMKQLLFRIEMKERMGK